MRIALIADIHANREALEAVLAAAGRDGCDRIVFLGDIIGYGPDPQFAIETVARMVTDGALAVLGNHDEAAGLTHATLDGNARIAMAWTRTQLSPDHVAFLDSLPLQIAEDDRLYVHASANQPDKWRYINGLAEAAQSLAATPARLTFCGHTHVPMHYHALAGRPPLAFRPLPDKPLPLSPLRRSLTVVGAAGQPRDGISAACYGLLDTAEKTITMRRVPYDVERTQQKIRDCGLPVWLGMRLAVGR
jgi:diadenosine tetraphosphatase ApaH/serine/threonine PP2A family protein phosphatase